MIVENEIVSQLLSRWFTEAALRLPLGSRQQKDIAALNNTLGSYLHFEYVRSQEIFMEIMRSVVFKPFKPEMGGLFVVKKTSYLTPFEPEFVLSASQAVLVR